ncbi:MAG: hypothetical protein ACO2ZZ_04230 [Cyclobacteriaceae bacterium]|jgi:hypothetical protein
MALFDQLYERLFKSKSPNAPVIYEPLQRSEEFLKTFIHWKNAGRLEEVREMVTRGYELKSKDLTSNPDVHILKGSSANGLAVSFDDTLNSDDLSFLMEAIKDQVLTQGYKQSNADQMIKEKGNAEEKICKYYLKPIISGDAPYDQKYGNVLIEEVFIDLKPSYLKLIVSTYHDSNYKSALPFSQLFKKLFLNEN